MALGDLVTTPYMFEYNGFAFGANTFYDIDKINGLLGFSIRSDSNDRFGRHGGSGARHYANMKHSSFDMNLQATSDSDYASKRQAIASAMQPIIDPKDALYLAFMLPNAGTTKLVTKCRPLTLDPDLTRSAALMYAPIRLRFEHLDPLIYSLTENQQSFTMPSDTRTINNAGNAKVDWKVSIAGPATNPIVTNNTTGQVIGFESLVLNGTQVLVIDSSNSTATVNGESVEIFLATGFSWWSLPPGNTSITVSASTATTAAATLFWRNGFWLP